MGYVLGNWRYVFILLNLEKVNDKVHVEFIYGNVKHFVDSRKANKN